MVALGLYFFNRIAFAQKMIIITSSKIVKTFFKYLVAGGRAGEVADEVVKQHLQHQADHPADFAHP